MVPQFQTSSFRSLELQGLSQRQGPLAWGQISFFDEITVEGPGVGWATLFAYFNTDQELGPEQLLEKLAILIERHEVLRTRYRFERLERTVPGNDTVLQEVLGSVLLEVPVVESDSLPRPKRSEIEDVLGVSPFQLGHGVPIRPMLVRAGDVWSLGVFVSHIACDAAGLAKLLQEFRTHPSDWLPVLHPIDEALRVRDEMSSISKRNLGTIRSQLSGIPQALAFEAPHEPQETAVAFGSDSVTSAVGRVARLSRISPADVITLLFALLQAVESGDPRTALIRSQVRNPRRRGVSYIANDHMASVIAVPIDPNWTSQQFFQTGSSVLLRGYIRSQINPTDLEYSLRQIAKEMGAEELKFFVVNVALSDESYESRRGSWPESVQHFDLVRGDVSHSTTTLRGMHATLDCFPTERHPVFIVSAYDDELENIGGAVSLAHSFQRLLFLAADDPDTTLERLMRACIPPK